MDSHTDIRITHIQPANLVESDKDKHMHMLLLPWWWACSISEQIKYQGQKLLADVKGSNLLLPTRRGQQCIDKRYIVYPEFTNCTASNFIPGLFKKKYCFFCFCLNVYFSINGPIGIKLKMLSTISFHNFTVRVTKLKDSPL